MKLKDLKLSEEQLFRVLMLLGKEDRHRPCDDDLEKRVLAALHRKEKPKDANPKKKRKNKNLKKMLSDEKIARRHIERSLDQGICPHCTTPLEDWEVARIRANYELYGTRILEADFQG